MSANGFGLGRSSYAGDIDNLLAEVTRVAPIEKLALHCHDTYGQALANIYRGLQLGITTFDSSVAGLGKADPPDRI